MCITGSECITGIVHAILRQHARQPLAQALGIQRQRERCIEREPARLDCLVVWLARAGAAEVTIVEENESSCRDAEHNAKANELSNVKVIVHPFAHARVAAEPDLMVVDPPRSGLGDAGIARVLKARPARLLYVACEAASLAHDLGPLVGNGYRVTAARLCDLFPHTEHVELVVMLDRKV